MSKAAVLIVYAEEQYDPEIVANGPGEVAVIELDTRRVGDFDSNDWEETQARNAVISLRVEGIDPESRVGKYLKDAVDDFMLEVGSDLTFDSLWEESAPQVEV